MGVILFPYLFWQVRKVETIRKDWITNHEIKHNRLILKGIIPQYSYESLSTDFATTNYSTTGLFNQQFVLFG